MTVLANRQAALSIGSALTHLRVKQGLSIKQLASNCHLPAPRLEQIEEGESLPSLTELEVLCRNLDTSAVDLIRIGIRIKEGA
ncbi:MAG: helix-turn-helix transcriptional regulator [Cyanobacteria bacterium HKST-UBA02]|nr:helix-turn-helix transcriptional regulator [Cyanobacteria bacterium HKST-UBA02]